MELITLKDHPKIASIVRLVSRKHKAFVRRQNAVALDGTAWDGGSRSTYYSIHLETKQVEQLPHSAPVQFGGIVPVAARYIDPGYAIVEAGTFCGKPSTPTIYLRPDCLL